MYMSGIESQCEWADELAKEALHLFGLQNREFKIIFWLPKRGKRKSDVTGGHAIPDRGLIEMMVDNQEFTEYKHFVVLHEVCHLIDRWLNGPPKRVNRRTEHHGTSFWEIALKVYEHFKILDYASTKEYIRGRKLIKARLEEISHEQRKASKTEGQGLRQECCDAA